VADVPAMRLLAAAKAAYVRDVLRATPAADLPILALATPYRAGGRGGALNYSELPAGPLTVRHLFDLYPYPNTIVAHRATGADLAEILERSAAQYLQLRPGGIDQPLIDPAYPGFAFASAIGVSYTVNLAQPARYDVRGTLIRPYARRISDLRLADRPLDPDAQVVLVSNNYRTGGTLGIAAPALQDILVENHTLCTDALRSFIQATAMITPEGLAGQGGWSLAPMPGTTVLFDTGAMAARHLDEAAHLRPEFVGLTEEGFRRYRLHL
jgi:2',3'-cyclic-nucleotide 2'-phosphodiesterase/3'-nucleotidase